MTMRNKEKREQSEARQKEEEEEEVSKRDHIACMLQLTNDTWPCDDHEPCHGHKHHEILFCTARSYAGFQVRSGLS